MYLKIIYKKINIIFISVLIIGCSSPQNYAVQLKEVIQKWNDALDIANSTPRIALSQSVARLQEIKRETASLSISKQMKSCHDHLLKYMDSRIGAFLMFMQEKESSAINLIKMADREFEEWQLCRLSPKEAKYLKKRLEAARQLSKSLCFGAGYGAGEFHFKYPKITIDSFDVYRKLFGNNGIMDVLDNELRKNNKEYIIPLVKSEMQRSCYLDYNSGYLFGCTGRVMDETNVQDKDLAVAFANIVTKSFIATTNSSNSLKIQQSQQKSDGDSLFVSGIIGGDEPIAIIGGRMFRKGEVVNSYQINYIADNYVEFLDKDGNIFRKKIEK